MRSPQPTLNMADINRFHLAFSVFLHILTPLLQQSWEGQAFITTILMMISQSRRG